MPSTARRWHPIQAVNAYAIRLVRLRDHREGTWLAVPWRLLSSTTTPFGEPVALSMTRRLWHRSWGAVAEGHRGVRLRKSHSHEPAYALRPGRRKWRSVGFVAVATMVRCGL